MILGPDLLDGRVDLHGVDVLRALRQGDGDVGAGPRADDQDVVERPVREPVVDLAVHGLGSARVTGHIPWCGMPLTSIALTPPDWYWSIR